MWDTDNQNKSFALKEDDDGVIQVVEHHSKIYFIFNSKRVKDC